MLAYKIQGLIQDLRTGVHQGSPNGVQGKTAVERLETKSHRSCWSSADCTAVMYSDRKQNNIFCFARGSGCKVLWWVHLRVCVCLFVCLEGCLRNHELNLYHIFVHVAYGRGSVLLWRRYDTLCTFCFVDDIMFFFYSRPYNGMNFATKDQFCFNLLIYWNIGQMHGRRKKKLI